MSPIAPKFTLDRLGARRRYLESGREEVRADIEAASADPVRRWHSAMLRLVADERQARVEARGATCGARTRAHTECLAPPVKVGGIAKNGRCKLHGGGR